MAQTARLKLDRKEAQGVLKHFLNSDTDFHFSPNYDPGLEEAESRFQQWSSDAEETLERCFTTYEVVVEAKAVERLSDRELMLRTIGLARKCTSEPKKIPPKVGAIIACDGVILG